MTVMLLASLLDRRRRCLHIRAMMTCMIPNGLLLLIDPAL